MEVFICKIHLSFHFINKINNLSYFNIIRYYVLKFLNNFINVKIKDYFYNYK